LGKIGAYKASQITERGQRRRGDRDTGTGKKVKSFPSHLALIYDFTAFS